MAFEFDVDAAQAFLREAVGMLGKQTEGSIRHVFSGHLPRIFAGESLPWWVSSHARGSETHTKSAGANGEKRGFIDTLVGSTAIEYEKDLRNAALAHHGLDQVKEYCAGLLNDQVPFQLIIGILSDTVHWQAYRVREVLPLPSGRSLVGPQDLILEQIEAIDLSAAGRNEAILLGQFLIRYLGRIGGRVLSAETLSFDLGFESEFCRRHLSGIKGVVDAAFKASPVYAALIEKVWSDFVSYLGDSGSSGAFDRETYISELYILTLAKLLCANVLEGIALVSDDDELTKILEGSFFQERGFSNLVEYDYFGWLNNGEPAKQLLPVAKQMQEDLAAYDFISSPAEDVFGTLMAQLARRSQRLLLGQEWTPSWLAGEIVRHVLARLPADQYPQLVDMCCGSGSMVVETVRQTLDRFRREGTEPGPESIARLSSAITGFDIDPLAVMLSKVTWILSAKEWISKSSAFDITIPIYHADSLFASTPVTRNMGVDGAERHELDLGGAKVNLPAFLVSPECALVFDAIVSNGYAIAMDAASSSEAIDLRGIPERLVGDAFNKAGVKVDQGKLDSAVDFANSLLTTLEWLQRSGRNGIWAFVLSNSYRPGLVAGKFNGLVSNPPWLAMSKVADNPYKAALTRMAEAHGIKPPGSSHLHAELSTLFLLHAVSRYLGDNAVVGCILPESVTSAHHHNPFRRGDYREAAKPVQFVPDELWHVGPGTFKNEAVVIFGRKSAAVAGVQLSGRLVGQGRMENQGVHVITQGDRTAWSDRPAASGATGFFDPAPFRQGADVFPRTAIFHDVAVANGRASLSRISLNSPLAYLIKDAKKNKDFYINANGIDARYLFDVLMSNHLVPFRIMPPAKGFLPLENNGGVWSASSSVSIRASGAATTQAFTRFFSVTEGDAPSYFESIDTPRHKLINQVFPERGWLVLMGAGGKLVCAAYEDISRLDRSRLIIDQTVYWVVVGSEDEAIYLTGLLNSEAINVVIRQFQPRGQFGERHVHKLPLGVTPKYDPTDVAHIDVVARTRALLRQLEDDEAVNADQYSGIFNPNQSLARRRTKLRDRLKLLDGYAEYDAACKSLYAV